MPLLVGMTCVVLTAEGYAAEHRIASPDGDLAVVVSDNGGLHVRVEVNDQVVSAKSPLGLEFKGGIKLGPAAAMNGDNAIQLRTPLAFLGKGQWTLRRFADNIESDDHRAVVESQETVDAQTVLSLSLKPAGGFTGILSQD